MDLLFSTKKTVATGSPIRPQLPRPSKSLTIPPTNLRPTVSLAHPTFPLYQASSPPYRMTEVLFPRGAHSPQVPHHSSARSAFQEEKMVAWLYNQSGIRSPSP
ncbi:hypothetical protein V2G26_020764 [Clonostachys chloroleuca]